MEDNILLTDKVSSLIKKFAIPAIISMVIAGIQTMIDGIFVGNVLGSNGMASVTLASPFMNLVIGLSMVVSIGSQSYMSIALGDGNKEKAQNIFKTFIYFIIVVGGLITLLGFFFSTEIAKILGADNTLVADVAIYIKCLSIYTIPLSIMFLFGFTARILEKPELYFKATLLSLISNIGLNYFLIYKLSLGIKGAAIATGLAYSLGLVVVIWPVLKKDSPLNIFKGKFDKNEILPVLYNGSSEGINSISAAVSAYIFNLAFMNIAGADGVAAFTAINYIAQFGIMVMFGISDGIGPIISYNYGNKRYDRVKETMDKSKKIILAVNLSIFLILVFFGKQLTTIFIQNNDVITNLVASGSKLYAIGFLFAGFNIVNSGYFTYIDQATNSIIVAASRGLIFIIIGIIILPKFLDISGVWLCIPFAEVITYLITLKLMNNSNKVVYGIRSQV